jgi:hypothetical protein
MREGYDMRIRNIIYLIWCAPLLLETPAAFAKSPPVGHRIYNMEEKFSDQPVKILDEKTDTRPTRFLKDPITAPQNMVLPKPSPQRAARVKEESLPGKIDLPAQAIIGRVIKPRVEFRYDTLGAKRKDEPVKVDYLNRIFVTADGLDIDL